MRQRNDTGHPQTVMAWPTDQDPGRRPFQIGPGEETDRVAEPLAGFTPVDDEAADESAEAAKPRTTRSSKSAASAAEGSETP